MSSGKVKLLQCKFLFGQINQSEISNLSEFFMHMCFATVTKKTTINATSALR